jgi:hypothetical protein
MKRFFLTAALGVVCIPAFAQGTLNFANGGPGLQAKVTDSNGVGLAGSAWTADLYWALGVVTDSSVLMALGQPATFSTIPSQAGFFFGGPRTIPGAAGNSVITAQVRVWDTVAADGPPPTQIGESILFQVMLAAPNATPPGIPTTMTALNGHPWSVGPIPEPSILTLGGFGLAGMLLLRRRASS